jgi:YD repeat-containing protein
MESAFDVGTALTTKATPEGTLNYTFDAAGNLASMTSSHTNGVSVDYAYDDLNRLSTVVDNRLGRVALDKDEVFVKAQIICAVRERRDHRQKG